MKKILSVNKATTATDIALVIARIGIAALMLTHGIPKLVMLFSGAPVQFPPVLGLIHAADPLSVKEPALHYFLVYIVLLLAGSGKYSIDYVLQLKGQRQQPFYIGLNSKRKLSG
jgi:putative oxidoreductase